MKLYICKKCIPFGAKLPCVLTGDDIDPTHCPCTDSSKPYAEWEAKAELCTCSFKEHQDCDLYNNGTCEA